MVSSQSTGIFRDVHDMSIELRTESRISIIYGPANANTALNPQTEASEINTADNSECIVCEFVPGDLGNIKMIDEASSDECDSSGRKTQGESLVIPEHLKRVLSLDRVSTDGASNYVSRSFSLPKIPKIKIKLGREHRIVESSEAKNHTTSTDFRKENKSRKRIASCYGRLCS